ncbi:MAG: hypothetical protein ACE5KD_00210 [Candidatus Bathyarchaeia archaeon]
MEKIVKKIPSNLWNKLSEKLVDILLKSSNEEKMSSELAKTILRLWQKNELDTEDGLQCLFQASMMLEREKTIELAAKMGLTEITAILREGVS